MFIFLSLSNMFYLPNKNLIVLKDYTKFKHNIMKYQISGTNHGGKVYVHEQNNYLHLSYNTLRAEIELKKTRFRRKISG